VNFLRIGLKAAQPFGLSQRPDAFEQRRVARRTKRMGALFLVTSFGQTKEATNNQ